MAVTKIINAASLNRNKLHLKKVWQYRSILLTFFIRDLKAQYAQTRLGIVWSFIQAITAALIVSLFFGILLKVNIPGRPYIIYAFPGLMSWYYFSYIVNNAGTSLVQAQSIIKKVYFPKLILPLYKSMVGLIEYLVWLLVLLGLHLYFGIPIAVQFPLILIAILLTAITGLSVAIWLSALTVRYRDASHIIPYLIGFGIFVTPVFFETAMIPAAYQFLMYLNPMAGVIAFSRWCTLGIPFQADYLFGFIPMIILFISGLYYFRRIEGIMTDVI